MQVTNISANNVAKEKGSGYGSAVERDGAGGTGDYADGGDSRKEQVGRDRGEDKLVPKGFKSLGRKYMHSPNITNTSHTYIQPASPNPAQQPPSQPKSDKNILNMHNMVNSQINKQNMKENINNNINSNDYRQNNGGRAISSSGQNGSSANYILGSRKVLKNIQEYYQEQLYKLNDKIKANNQQREEFNLVNNRQRKGNVSRDNRKQTSFTDKSSGKKQKQTQLQEERDQNYDKNFTKINIKYKQRSNSQAQNKNRNKSTEKQRQLEQQQNRRETQKQSAPSQKQRYQNNQQQQSQQKSQQQQQQPIIEKQKQNQIEPQKLTNFNIEKLTNKNQNIQENSGSKASKYIKNHSYKYSNLNYQRNQEETTNPTSIQKRNKSNLSNPSPNKIKMAVLSNYTKDKQNKDIQYGQNSQKNHTQLHHLSNPKSIHTRDQSGNQHTNIYSKQKQIKQKLKSLYQNRNIKKDAYYQNSPSNVNNISTNDNSTLYNLKFGSNKVINSNTKNNEQFMCNINTNANNLNVPNAGNGNIVSSFKSPTKQIYVSPSSSNIICESVSKDGNFKVVSRALNAEELKQAVELEHNINMKAKKQSIKQLQQNTKIIKSNSTLNIGQDISPKNCKYILDPSKISNKQNGNVKAYAVNSNQGISRKYNEDRVSIILNITKNNVKASYFAVYDGHGGSNCCDFLTQNLHQYIFNSKYFPSQPRQALIQGMKLAQTKFIQLVKNNYKQKKQIDRSGSCAIILLIVGDDCYIANLGDSRAVLSSCNGKPMYSLSRDHKPTDSGQQSRILKEGGKIYRTEMVKIKKQVSPFQNKRQEDARSMGHQNQVIIGPLRVYPGKLSVTRTFGDIQAKQPQFGGIRNCISIQPQICKYSLTGKQDFILLGCDGIFQKLDSEQVIQQVWRCIRKNKNASVHQAIGAATQSVVKLCMDRKSTDNITAILVCLSNLGLGNNLSDYASV